jgi:hypothetical protein
MKSEELFNPEELRKVDSEYCVVLASGGPLLKIICIEGDNAVVQVFDTGDRHILPKSCLRKLVKL